MKNQRFRLLHNRQQTISELATLFQGSYKTIEEWNYKYKINGEIGLEEATSWNQRRIEGAEMIHSMSRVGMSIDNGPMESFWRTLKCEKYY